MLCAHTYAGVDYRIFHSRAARTLMENKTEFGRADKANVWLQPIHEQEAKQQITFTHKCPIMQYNVQSGIIPSSVPLHRPKPTSLIIPLASATLLPLSRTPPFLTRSLTNWTIRLVLLGPSVSPSDYSVIPTCHQTLPTTSNPIVVNQHAIFSPPSEKYCPQYD